MGLETLDEELAKRFPNATRDCHKSRTSAIKLMCLGCVNGSIEEVRRCPCNACPLYRWRPFKEIIKQ